MCFRHDIQLKYGSLSVKQQSITLWYFSFVSKLLKICLRFFNLESWKKIILVYRNGPLLWSFTDFTRFINNTTLSCNRHKWTLHVLWNVMLLLAWHKFQQLLINNSLFEVVVSGWLQGNGFFLSLIVYIHFQGWLV